MSGDARAICQGMLGSYVRSSLGQMSGDAWAICQGMFGPWSDVRPWLIWHRVNSYGQIGPCAPAEIAYLVTLCLYLKYDAVVTNLDERGLCQRGVREFGLTESIEINFKFLACISNPS